MSKDDCSTLDAVKHELEIDRLNGLQYLLEAVCDCEVASLHDVHFLFSPIFGFVELAL